MWSQCALRQNVAEYYLQDLSCPLHSLTPRIHPSPQCSSCNMDGRRAAAAQSKPAPQRRITVYIKCSASSQSPHPRRTAFVWWGPSRRPHNSTLWDEWWQIEFLHYLQHALALNGRLLMPHTSRSQMTRRQTGSIISISTSMQAFCAN